MAEQVTVPDIRARKRSQGQRPHRDDHRLRRALRRGSSTPPASTSSSSGDTLAEVVLGHADTLQRRHRGARPPCRRRWRARDRGPCSWATCPGSPTTSRRATPSAMPPRSCGPAPGRQARGRPAPRPSRAGDPRRRDTGDGPPRAHAAVGHTPWAATRFKAARRPRPSELRRDAEALAEAGCFAIVLEGVPDVLAERVTAEVDVPTIGIGAGAACDGQVIVLHDLLGLVEGQPARGSSAATPTLGTHRHRGGRRPGEPTCGRPVSVRRRSRITARASCARRSTRS